MWSYVLKCLWKNNFFTISIAGHLNICLSSESGISGHIQVFVVHIVKDCTDPWNDPKGRRRLEEFSPMGEENGGALKDEGCADWKSLRRVFLHVIVQEAKFCHNSSVNCMQRNMFLSKLVAIVWKIHLCVEELSSSNGQWATCQLDVGSADMPDIFTPLQFALPFTYVWTGVVHPKDNYVHCLELSVQTSLHQSTVFL